MIASAISAGVARLIVPKPQPQVTVVKENAKPPPDKKLEEQRVAEPESAAVLVSSDDEPIYVTGIGVKFGRYNITLSDGSERTESDGTVESFGRNYVDLTDLGRLWVRPKPIVRETAALEPPQKVPADEVPTNAGSGDESSESI